MDYWKAYGTVPHTWVIKSLNMVDISKNVVSFLGKKMKS